MFAIMSGEVSLFYRLIRKTEMLDLIMFFLGFVILLMLLKIKKAKKREIDVLLAKMEE